MVNRQLTSLRMRRVLLLALGATIPNLIGGGNVSAANKSWFAGDGTWGTATNWFPAGVPADGDAVQIGNVVGVQNATVSLGAVGSVRPDTLTISDGMTVRTNSSLVWAGERVVIEGSNLVGGGGGIATLYRSTLILDGVLKGNSLLTDFLDINNGGRLLLTDSALAQVFNQMTIDSNATAEGTGTIAFNNSGRTLVNNGVIRAGGAEGLTVRQQELTEGRLDLDGDLGLGRLEAPAGRTLAFVDDELNDSFSGQILLDSGADLRMAIANGWTADAQSSIDIASSIAGAPSELNGGHFTFGGAMSIDGDVARFDVNAATTLLATANLHVAQGDRIRFLGDTSVVGGSIQTVSGDPQDGRVEFAGSTNWNGDVNVTGSLVQTGEATVTGPSVVNATTFDMDGPIGNQTVWNINNTMVVNATSIDAQAGNTFYGELNITGGFLPKLTLNLSDPGDHWVMAGTMSLMGDPGIFLDRVSGSQLVSFGDVNVTSGRVRITADTQFWTGSLNIGPATAILQMTGETLLTYQVEVSGQGALRNGATGRLTLTSTASLNGVGLINDGELRIGYASPGLAACDRFTSSGAATWFVDIGGYDLGAEFDHLQVTGGPAALDGLLDVSLIDTGDGLFLPQVGDEFTILTALGGVTGTFLNSPVSMAGGQTYHWTVDYNPYDVTLRLTSITVPEPGSSTLLILGVMNSLRVSRRRRCFAR